MTEEVQEPVDDGTPPAAQAETNESSTIKSLRRQLADASKKLKKFDGVDLDALKDAQERAEKFADITDEDVKELRHRQQLAENEEERRILKEHGIDGLVTHRTKQKDVELERRLAAIEAEREEAKKEAQVSRDLLTRDRLRAEVLAWVSGSGEKLHDNVGGLIEQTIRDSVFFEGDHDPVIRIRDSENPDMPMHSAKDVTQPMKVAEYLETHLREKHPSFFRAPSSPTVKGGTTAAAANNPFVTGDRGAQMRAIKKNKAEAQEMAAHAERIGKGHMIKIASFRSKSADA